VEDDGVARIRHLALRTNDMAGVAAFYERAFGMREVHRHASVSGPGHAIYLSDGYINLAIIPARDQPEGLFHFGFAVDDVESTVAQAVAAGAQASNEELPRDGRFTERFVTDPAGNRVDITRGWEVEP
jgi:catechol 2,3-dioxygenase-like lactoylglutathione lyase family enzyme